MILQHVLHEQEGEQVINFSEWEIRWWLTMLTRIIDWFASTMTMVHMERFHHPTLYTSFSLVISCWLQFCVPCFVYQTLVSITSFLVHCCFILVREETSMIQKLHACISKHSCFVHLVLLFATIPRVFVINNNNKVNLVDPMLRECSMWNKYRW